MPVVDWVCKKISLESASERLSAITISRQQVLPIKHDACANVTTCCCACVGLWFIEECVVLRLCQYIVYKTRNVWRCACVGLWFIERGILHLECAFLRFCACVGLWFIERRILHLECASLAVRIVRIERIVP